LIRVEGYYAVVSLHATAYADDIRIGDNVAITNVTALQREPTHLVDVHYDLASNTAPVFVSVAVSTNGGASYNVPVSHLSGDGITNPVSAGAGRHVVWDAGTDLPNQLLSQVRIKVIVPPGGGTAEASSPAFALDTRYSLADGLVAYYPFDGNANDASGNGNNGVLHGNTSWVPGVTSQGLRFDGASTYIVVPNFTFQPRDKFSVAFWAKPDTDCGTGSPRHFLSKHWNIPDMEFLIRMEQDGKYNSAWSIGGNYYDLANYPSVYPTVGLIAPTFTNFDCIVNTYDGSSIRFYVNGTLVKEQAASGTIQQSSVPLTIGAYAADPTAHMFKGVMDNIRIYNRVLSQDEIQQLYVADGGLNAGLVAYYPFDGNANDASGNGRNGVTHGAISAPDRFGRPAGALHFPGYNEYVSIPVFAPAEYTMACWIRPLAQTPGGGHRIFHSSSPLDALALALTEDCHVSYRVAPGPWTYLATQLQTNAWTHLAFIGNSSHFSVYANGRQVEYVSPAAGIFPQIDEIGHRWLGNPVDALTGDLDDIRIYNRALSPTEVQALYNVGSGQPALSNIRASQRAGTNLVDVWYDLSRASAPVIVSVSISTNGGASYALQPAHLTGDGVTAPVGSGTSRHLVWDAGADWPGILTYSARVRVSVQVGDYVSKADGSIPRLDTRSVPTGTLAGRVFGNGSPLANAQVRVEGTSYATNTLGNGTFSLANIAVGSGYVLNVSADGCAPLRKPDVAVAVGTNNLGDLSLTNAARPYRLIALVPDVNPTVTEVEEGGTAYRYYQVVAADGKTSVTSSNVALRISGGSMISQANDVSDIWPGRIVGIADADGIVRLRVPASELGPVNTLRTLEILESGVVQTNFQARVIPREYEHVWKHKIGGGVSGKFEVVKGGVEGSAETEVRHGVKAGAIQGETIAHTLVTKLQGGLEVKTPVIEIVKLGTGLRGISDVRTAWNFDPLTQNPSLNGMKYCLALGDPLTAAGEDSLQWGVWAAPIVAPNRLLYQTALFGYVLSDIVPRNLNLCDSVQTDFKIDYYAEGKLGVRIPGTPVDVNLIGGSLESQLFFNGYEFNNANQESAEIASEFIGDRVNLSFITGLNYGVAEQGERVTKQWSRSGEDIPYRTEVITRATSEEPGGWGVTQIAQDVTESSDTVTWTNMAPSTARYVRHGYAGWRQGVSVDLSVDVGIGVGLKLGGDIEKGVEAVTERGQVWHSKRAATELYDLPSTNLFPSESIVDLELSWLRNASPLIPEALNHMAQQILTNVSTVVQAGCQFGRGGVAVLSLQPGVMQPGSVISSSWILNQACGFGMNFLPPAGTSNYVYGIGGVFRFESTNSFNGTGTLAIAYGDAEVVGLNEADLRIYQLADGTNRWCLVGGTVDAVSNRVTATIANLGTYAVAPPLPTGALQLQPSTNALPADGVSQMTVTVTNLLLNTGGSATQAWLFTASAFGVTILDADASTNTSGVQIVSTNAALTLHLLAPPGGNYASVSLQSVAGDAAGQIGFDLVDTTPPATPANVSVTPGQSRIWISWRTNSEPDLGSYRVYYRMGQSGPPWDGAAAIEGSPSPVIINSTNCLLRGLALGTNYLVAVSAVDTTGNESPLSAAVSVTTTQAPPAAPTGVAVRFGADGTNVLMWALSEDDGYNDRDVIRYDILRAVLPGGSYGKAGEVAAGIGIYSETNLTVASTQYVRYAVVAVASNSLTSAQTLANRLMPDGVTIDNDGDGIPDWWLINYFGHPTGQASDNSLAQDNPAGDGLSNLQKYLLGRNPLIWDNLHFVGCDYQSGGRFNLSIFGQAGSNYTLLASTDLVNWASVLNFTCTNSPTIVVDPGANYFGARFYRLVQGTLPIMVKLNLNTPTAWTANGLGLNLEAPLGFNYTIQASTNLLDWQPITNFVGTNSPLYFSDPAATNFNWRFYRAVMP
jgi:hypothetical protein